MAFQGERGAFSEEAALKLLGPEIELVPRKTFADLYQSLDNGVADYLLAPVENTIAGVVQPSVDLLNSSSLNVLDEVQIKIEQHLIGCPGAAFDIDRDGAVASGSTRAVQPLLRRRIPDSNQ